MEKTNISFPINVILNGSNYVIWTQKMSNFLKGRKLWQYVTNDIPKPLKKEEMKISNYIALLDEWDSQKLFKLLLGFIIPVFQ